MSHVWTTTDEVAFVRELGMHSATPMPRRQLLDKYWRAAALRENWGRLQPDVILTEVVREQERYTCRRSQKSK